MRTGAHDQLCTWDCLLGPHGFLSVHRAETTASPQGAGQSPRGAEGKDTYQLVAQAVGSLEVKGGSRVWNDGVLEHCSGHHDPAVHKVVPVSPRAGHPSPHPHLLVWERSCSGAVGVHQALAGLRDWEPLP